MTRWRKSSGSSGECDCIEVGVTEGAIVLRDSKNVDGPHLAVRPEGWKALILAIKSGEID
jgi:hypothetical protein